MKIVYLQDKTYAWTWFQYRFLNFLASLESSEENVQTYFVLSKENVTSSVFTFLVLLDNYSIHFGAIKTR